MKYYWNLKIELPDTNAPEFVQFKTQQQLEQHLMMHKLSHSGGVYQVFLTVCKIGKKEQKRQQARQQANAWLLACGITPTILDQQHIKSLTSNTSDKYKTK